MGFILRQLRGAGHNQTIADRRIESDKVTIGRGADRDILVNDKRVAWHHAYITKTGNRYSVVVEPEAGVVTLNGSPVARGNRLDDGDVITLGGTEIRFRIFEGRVYLEVVEAPKVKNQHAIELREQAKLRLPEVGVSKRRWSWGLFITVLVLGLMLPLGARMAGGLYDTLKSTPIPLDDLWNSGPISAAHQTFAMECDECHLKLFEQVPDRACASCHEDIKHHDDDVELLNTSGMQNYSCTDCHHEHSGDEGLILAHPKLCTDCHAAPAQKMPGSTLLAASDFLYDHPELSPQAWVEDKNGKRADKSVPITPAMTENANLIYPHDLHLEPEGVEDTNGDNHVLECESCHEYESGEISFQSVDFEQHCQYCHSLDFDPAQPDRQVPHGNTEQVLADLRGYYAIKVLRGEDEEEITAPSSSRGRQRSVQTTRSQNFDSMLAKAESLASNMIDETIRVRLCAKCHIIGPPTGADTDWDVTPFIQREIWMTDARFDHSRHQAEPCESCHLARPSATADDVLMPDIASCRDCHGGNRTQAPLIRSLCIDCHGFHLAEEAEMHTMTKMATMPAMSEPAMMEGAADAGDASDGSAAVSSESMSDDAPSEAVTEPSTGGEE